MYEDIKTIVINKNRGWRGLAEALIFDKDTKTVLSMIFSFSQDVWDDMLGGHMVLQDNDNYIVLTFGNTEALPKGQRSVLIKDFSATVVKVNTYKKTEWVQQALNNNHYKYISNFKRNKNNHTRSNWNCIGIRVIPIV